MKTVTINSLRNIFVFGSNVNQYKKNDNGTITQNSSSWTNTRVLIRQGIHQYNAEIAEWATVKALVAKGVMTVSVPTESTDENPEGTAAVEATKKAEALDKEQKVQEEREKRKKKKLDEIAEKAADLELQNLEKAAK